MRAPKLHRTMKVRQALARALAAVMLAGSLTAIACPELPAGHVLEGERYRLSYRTVPEQIVIGQHFRVEFAVCPRPGQPVPESVRVDATMPEHRHGMNYKPTIRSLTESERHADSGATGRPGAAARYTAEGLLFHMAGRWEMVFEVRGAGNVDRMARDHVM